MLTARRLLAFIVFCSVWLAGPISGFVVHPVIGALSDNSSSKYRRRRWVVYGTVFITVATFTLAFAGELATRLVDLFNRGQGDWDPQRDADVCDFISTIRRRSLPTGVP